MAKALNLQGRTFGRLTVLGRGPNKGRHSYCLCSCSCGKSHLASQDGLVGGLIKSCGCLRKEVTRNRSLTHGATIGRKQSREYRSWLGAKDRCYNPHAEKYPIYGGRGISMHESWLNDFGTFLKDMGKRPAKHTLDRIENDGNYAPGNCRWATINQQTRNTRANIWITYKGLTMIEADWAREFKIDKKIFNKKWKQGTPIEEIESFAETKNARILRNGCKDYSWFRG